mgnify:CR=1 FL=1
MRKNQMYGCACRAVIPKRATEQTVKIGKTTKVIYRVWKQGYTHVSQSNPVVVISHRCSILLTAHS